jgi:S1-C subfamily serine protease
MATHVVAEAVSQWRPAVIALGAITDPPQPRPALMGSGFIIDAHAGIIATCAHVIADLQSVHGFAHIAVGLGSPIEWRFRALVRRSSPPPANHPVGQLGGLDLALLQLTSDLAGGPLPLAVLIHAGGTLPLDLVALPLGDSDELQPGEPLVVLGYGQPQHPHHRSETATNTQGVFSGTYKDESPHRTGWWLKTDSLVLSGHSGGPALNRHGCVVG